MKSDIQIAHETQLERIENVAAQIGIDANDLEHYGKYIAKLPLNLIGKQKGKLILVTAITATKAGIGKTTVSIGLALGLNKIGKKAVVALREPSLGTCFGMKGGAAGGGYAQVLPMEKINLHFTGDFHAITSPLPACRSSLRSPHTAATFCPPSPVAAMTVCPAPVWLAPTWQVLSF